MRGLKFNAARDSRLVASLQQRAGSPVTVVPAVPETDPPTIPETFTIYAKVNENRQAFSLKVGSEFLDTMEGKAALFYMSDAAYQSIPDGAELIWGGERWLVSAEIEENRQSAVVERIVLCDGGLFPHLCDIWSETIPIVAGKPQPAVYALVAANQPCWYQFTSNVDEPTGMGRDNSANFFTRDTVHFKYDSPVKNGYWLINRSHIGGSTQGDLIHEWGAVSRVQGAPLYTHPSSLRRIGKLTVNAMVDEAPPIVLAEASGKEGLV